MELEIRLHQDKAELVGPNGVMATKEKKMADVLDTGFVSVEVRYHNPFRQIMVLERPPTVNSLAASGRKDKMWDIPIPWQVYLVDYSMGTVRIFFRKEPLTSLDDELFLCYLDHIKPDGESCIDRQHAGNVADILEDVKEDPVSVCVSLVNDSIWGGTVRGASYMKWYADIPKEIREEDLPYDNVSETLDKHFDLARVMDEVTLCSYGDKNLIPARGDHRSWSDWFGKPLTVKDAIAKIASKRYRQPSAKAYFENHV